MNINTLKAKIKKKFGNMSKFARVAKINRYGMQKQFASPGKYRKSLLEIDRLATRLKANTSGVEILPSKLKSLRTHVMNCGGVLAFCYKNPNFNSRTVFQILQGRRKRMSPIVKELFEHFDL